MESMECNRGVIRFYFLRHTIHWVDLVTMTKVQRILKSCRYCEAAKFNASVEYRLRKFVVTSTLMRHAKFQISGTVQVYIPYGKSTKIARASPYACSQANDYPPPRFTKQRSMFLLAAVVALCH
jgi:hypothetical protein